MNNPALKVAVSHPVGNIKLEIDVATQARCLAVEGPSGAGKSTFLRLIAGITRARSGTVVFADRVWQDGTLFIPPWQRRTAWVPQDALLFPHLTVRGNLTFAGTHPGLAEVAGQLGLNTLLDRWPRHLSGGERQRVALGRALLSGSQLLLLDEPFAALDRALRDRARSCVRTWAEKTCASIVLVSHHASDADALSAERWICEDGRISRL
jgi:molybdate transport system ATP-binding protein